MTTAPSMRPEPVEGGEARSGLTANRETIVVRYLILANQTLGGQELDNEIELRIKSGAAQFYVVVPMTEPEQETTAWMPDDPMFQIPEGDDGPAEARDEARRRSEHRLTGILDRIRAAGGEAEGEVGDPDPYTAAKNVLDRRTFDAIIVSTLPTGVSRWLKMDLPSRLGRLSEAPVTAIEAS